MNDTFYKLKNSKKMSEVEWLNNFGDNLRSLIQEEGITQEQLAYEADLSQAAVSRYVNKERIPTIRAAINMAEVLKVSLDDLLYFGKTIE